MYVSLSRIFFVKIELMHTSENIKLKERIIFSIYRVFHFLTFELCIIYCIGTKIGKRLRNLKKL